eukprot:5876746-Prymnesium_polylepis.1
MVSLAAATAAPRHRGVAVGHENEPYMQRPVGRELKAANGPTTHARPVQRVQRAVGDLDRRQE